MFSIPGAGARGRARQSAARGTGRRARARSTPAATASSTTQATTTTTAHTTHNYTTTANRDNDANPVLPAHLSHLVAWWQRINTALTFLSSNASAAATPQSHLKSKTHAPPTLCSLDNIAKTINVQRQPSSLSSSLSSSSITSSSSSSSISRSTSLSSLSSTSSNDVIDSLQIDHIAAILHVAPHLISAEWILPIWFTDKETYPPHSNQSDDPQKETDYQLILSFTPVGTRKMSDSKNILNEKENAPKPKPKRPCHNSKTSSLLTQIQTRNVLFEKALHLYYIEHMTESAQEFHASSLSALPPRPEIQPSQESARNNSSEFVSDFDPVTLEDFLIHMKKDPQGYYQDRIDTETRWITVPARSAVYGNLFEPLSKECQEALKICKGVEKLYRHQAEAINHVMSGKHVVVSTSTASGKSVIYQIPVIKALEQNQSATALFIFPTKALSQDQKQSMQSLLSNHPKLSHLSADTYDGDTLPSIRKRIRTTTSILITNPDMLHISLLPNHKLWKHFWQNLKFVLVDELHVYAGRFGLSCSLIMKRLKRVLQKWGNEDVRFIACSATIGNPFQHFQAFFDLPSTDIKAIIDDTSPSATKHHIIWTPPFKSQTKKIDSGSPTTSNNTSVTQNKQSDCGPSKLSVSSSSANCRVPYLYEAVDVCFTLLKMSIRFLCFAKTRKACEYLLSSLHRRLQNEGKNDWIQRVVGYRGGYTPSERRDIEDAMKRNDVVVGVIATNALEVGMDVGCLDVVVHLGFPYSISSYRQQSGRAGRRGQVSASIFIADELVPIDKYYIRNPTSLVTHPDECVSIGKSQIVLESHLHCSASEIPLTLEEARMWLCDVTSQKTKDSETDVKTLADIDSILQCILRWDPKYRVFFSGREDPCASVCVRGGWMQESWRVIDVMTNKDIEEVEFDRVPFTLYEGSVFIHQGKSYLIFDLHYERKYAKARPANVDYVTEVRDFTNIDPMKTYTSALLKSDSTVVSAEDILNNADLPMSITKRGLYFYFGELQCSTTCFGYTKLNPITKQIHEVITNNESDPMTKTVQGIWIDIPPDIVKEVQDMGHDIEFSLHAASHALLSALPCVIASELITDQADIRTECKTSVARRYRAPRLILYESVRCGVLEFMSGHNMLQLLSQSLSILESCNCSPEVSNNNNQSMNDCHIEENVFAGCPNCCVLRGRACKHGNEALDKYGAVAILTKLLGVSLN